MARGGGAVTVRVPMMECPCLDNDGAGCGHMVPVVSVFLPMRNVPPGGRSWQGIPATTYTGYCRICEAQVFTDADGPDVARALSVDHVRETHPHMMRWGVA